MLAGSECKRFGCAGGAFAWLGEGGEFTRLRTQQTKGGWTEKTLGGSMASREGAGNLSSMNG